MKSVLISIQPKWCELIASGQKTVEVRKTKPELETPFKCYIYCTKGKFEPHEHLRNNLHYDDSTIKVCEGQGKVIGEFVCDRIIDIPFSKYFIDYYHTMQQVDLEATCLDMDHIDDYLLSKDGYGWHISDLVIYDLPKKLSEFRTHNVRTYIDEKGYPMPTHAITRPPQPWCYVEGGE